MIGDVSQLDYFKITGEQQNKLNKLKYTDSLVTAEEDAKPQLLYTKLQRLKNSATKLARVLIVDENPVLRDAS